MYSAFHPQDGFFTLGAPHASAQSQNGYNGAMNSGSYLPQGSIASIPSHLAPQAPIGQLSQNTDFIDYGGSSPHTTSHMVSHSPMPQATQFNGQSFMGQQGSAAHLSSLLLH
ncbi:clathrin interactor EPSIN 3-like [Arachis hypogaea]|nr:clathrin interactor EPSIN 3-like [Arachis hypogaea]